MAFVLMHHGAIAEQRHQAISASLRLLIQLRAFDLSSLVPERFGIECGRFSTAVAAVSEFTQRNQITAQLLRRRQQRKLTQTLLPINTIQQP